MTSTGMNLRLTVVQQEYVAFWDHTYLKLCLAAHGAYAD